MRTIRHPGQPVAWLIIVLGAAQAVIALAVMGLNPGQGLRIPWTPTAVDPVWLLVSGGAWLVIGALALLLVQRWAIELPPEDGVRAGELHAARAEWAARQEAAETRIDALETGMKPVGLLQVQMGDVMTRFGDIDGALYSINTRLEVPGERPANLAEMPELAEMRRMLGVLEARLGRQEGIAAELMERLEGTEAQFNDVEALQDKLHAYEQRLAYYETLLGGAAPGRSVRDYDTLLTDLDARVRALQRADAEAGAEDETPPGSTS